MSAKLREEDSRAVDVLLDRGSVVSGLPANPSSQPSDGMSTAGFSLHASPVEPERMKSVQQVLDLLKLLPDEEPPAGLVERTLARIDRQALEAVSGDVAGEPAPFRSSALVADPSLPPA
jgi:hypothetical protein